MPSQRIFSSNPIKGLATEGNITLLLITLILCYVFYRSWKNWKLVLGILVAVIVVDFLFGIAFVFTLPLWTGLAFILFIYGLTTGKFKKPIDANGKKGKPGVILLLVIFGFGYYSYFGGIKPCIYDYFQSGENYRDLLNYGPLTLNEDVYVVSGGEFDSYNCFNFVGPSFKHNILAKKDLDDSCVNCKDVFRSQGATITTLPAGTKFQYQATYYGGRRGLTAFNSSQSTYWELKGEDGENYTLLLPSKYYEDHKKMGMFKEFAELADSELSGIFHYLIN